jgi:GT2 family glycosyltransferase
MAPLPRCSVVIVTWNRRKELEAAIHSLKRQTLADEIETIVIDNGSTDGTVEWLRGMGDGSIRLLEFKENRGASHGRNAGIRAARAPLVCFLDSDAEIISPDAIERCIGRLGRGDGVRAVTTSIWFDREKTRPFSKGVYITPEGHYSGIRSRTETADPHVISSCFAVWEKSLLEELGGFDPWYFWGIEDLDLSLRAYHRSLLGEARGASRFFVLEDVHVLHEMSHKGRHYLPTDFDAVFHAIERQRLYMVLAHAGGGGILSSLDWEPCQPPARERRGVGTAIAASQVALAAGFLSTQPPGAPAVGHAPDPAKPPGHDTHTPRNHRLTACLIREEAAHPPAVPAHGRSGSHASAACLSVGAAGSETCRASSGWHPRGSAA